MNTAQYDCYEANRHRYGNGFKYHRNNMASTSFNQENTKALQMNASATGM